MANDTLIQQGRFTSAGSAETITVRSDIDWFRVYNTTVAAASQTTAVGVEYLWLRGFPSAAMWEYKKSNAANAANLSNYATSGGFTLVDSSDQSPGALTAVTSISTASPPVVTVASTASLSTGDIVRLINITGGQQLGGIPFRIAVTAGTTFNLTYMSAIAAATTGYYRVIPYEPLFAPKHRYITTVTKASSAVVTTSTDHNYTVGQSIRFVVPSEYGMIELDGLTGVITAVTTSTFTVDIDSTAFTTFAFPATAKVPFSPALAVPNGEDLAQVLSSSAEDLADSVYNSGYMGIKLAAGTNSPAGSTSDVIYWMAGKSFSVSNS